MNDLEQTWTRIHHWLELHCPIVLASLGPPATEDQFREAEVAMGISLPESVKACYRFHDGQQMPSNPVSYFPEWEFIPEFLNGEEWYSLSRMVRDWQSMQGFEEGIFGDVPDQQRGPVRQDVWHPKWLPLTSNGSGYLHCIDLAPRFTGRIGQIISWCHDSPERRQVARNLPEWLKGFALRLEQGIYTTVPGKHGPVLIRVRDV